MKHPAIRKFRLGDLVPMDDNPRVISEKALSAFEV